MHAVMACKGFLQTPRETDLIFTYRSAFLQVCRCFTKQTPAASTGAAAMSALRTTQAALLVFA